MVGMMDEDGTEDDELDMLRERLFDSNLLMFMIRLIARLLGNRCEQSI